jgi:hypothetical protein
MGKMAPEGWWYLEAMNDENGEIIVVWACSDFCKMSMWKLGPGKLDLTTNLDLDI